LTASVRVKTPDIVLVKISGKHNHGVLDEATIKDVSCLKLHPSVEEYILNASQLTQDIQQMDDWVGLVV